MDKQYAYISEQKILQNWEAIKANGKAAEVIGLATEWANFIQKSFQIKNSDSDTLKRDILFRELNLSLLENENLIIRNGSIIGINPTGEPITENDYDNIITISIPVYQVIRIAATEIIWQMVNFNSSWKN